MTFEQIEKLAPHLAWPLVALIIAILALPILISKIGKIAKIIDGFRDTMKELPDTLAKFEEFNSSIGSVQGGLENVVKTLDQLNARQLTDDTADDIVEQTEPEEASNGNNVVVNKFEQMQPEQLLNYLGDMNTRWKAFLVEFDKAFSRAGLERPDKRRVGVAAVELKHGNRKNHLEDADVKLIAELHGMYMGFRRRKNEEIREWLTSPIYERFLRGVEKAQEKIKIVSPR